MSNHPITEQLLNIVAENLDIVGHPEWEHIEPKFDATFRAAIAQAWQDGHDTALINGQSQNPHEQEPR